MDSHVERNVQTSLLSTEMDPPIYSQQTSTTLNENDKIIFDELKRHILQEDWEQLLAKLLEFPDFPIDAQSGIDQNYTLVHHAAESKSVECLRTLVMDFSANPNIKADNGWVPIHLVVITDCRCEHCTKKTLDSLEILVESGANVNSEDDLAGETPLYYAARNRHSKAAEFLLNNGANINHWGNGTSAATILAQFVPDVLKSEFDKCITIHEKERTPTRGLRLDFRLLLQDVAIHEGFTVRSSSKQPSPTKRVFTGGWSQRRLQNGFNRGSLESAKKGVPRNRNHANGGGGEESAPPTETQLLNYLLRADMTAIEAVVNHPFVEAFVHLKWLSVRKVFFFFRSLYLFLISLYTFYVFDTFVNDICFYETTTGGAANSTLSTSVASEKVQQITGRDDSSVEKPRFGFFFPIASSELEDKGLGKQQSHGNSYREWSSFSEYFKAHEMSCEPTTRTTVLAYLFAIFAVCTVLYELYKVFESWYDYFKAPLNFAWWILAISIGISLSPGFGVYAHTWHYPHAAFTLIYGWILVLAQVGRIPYFGIFVGIFVKVLKDFCLLLFTFSPVLLAFALGFSVILPQNEFFRFIPLGVFKVFLMMTGDVDFWGVFSGTWTSSTKLRAHLHFPLFIIYSVYILMVAMVLMSLLLGLAVDNIQEVRREAALHRTVRLIQEIGIFESIFHKPALYYCGCSRYFRRLFSITSLDITNGRSELISFPEDPNDESLPSDIKQKLIPYLLKSCCCPDQIQKRNRIKRGIGKETKKDGSNTNHNFMKLHVFSLENPASSTLNEMKLNNSTKPNDEIRMQFFEANQNDTRALVTRLDQGHSMEIERSAKERVLRDLMIYQEVKLLLDDNEKLRGRLESLQRKLMSRK